MQTKWGMSLDPLNVLPEYPRPQLMRDSFMSLNGYWDYCITESPEMPTTFDGRILVPFSPESELSGVSKTLSPTQTLWYKKELTLSEDFLCGRTLLHFGAVDQEATIYLNGVERFKHKGGFTPFTVELTPYDSKPLTILIRVTDGTETSGHARGKQSSKRGGIWYTPQSGIWQTVWIENVPDDYIQDLRITPDYDAMCVRIQIQSERDLPATITLNDKDYSAKTNTVAELPMPDFRPWSPEDPFLYPLTIRLGTDLVQSYFGMRKFSVEPDRNGIPRLFLNNRPYFHNGLLDQGYYPDGLLTAPSDEAMIGDIQKARSMGFNMLRKHIKIEPLRWYYHCDRLGMLVWQDMINGGGKYSKLLITYPLFIEHHMKDKNYRLFGRKDPESRAQYREDLEAMLRHLVSVVSIAVWVPFNEGWGQFDAAKIAAWVREYDPTRTIDHASGWHDQGAGDLNSHHVYFHPFRFKKDRRGRAVVLSEFGGYNYRVENHAWNNADFGYKRISSSVELIRSYRRLYEEEILPARRQGLAAAVYTQLTDVEDELNGLLTYDREVVKIPEEILREINARVSGSIE
jgi:beta-galactosidase/beta-glucuronidase